MLTHIVSSVESVLNILQEKLLKKHIIWKQNEVNSKN